MNNVKKNRTGLRLLGSVRGGNYRRFTMNKTQQNQPVYKNIEPRCPGTKGKRGCTDCSGSNTNVGCKTCWGCNYTFDVSSVAFRGAYPSYGSFANVNLLVDNSNNPPCEWQYNAIVEGFSIDPNDPSNARVSINIEDNKCVGDISGVYFYAPVGGNSGTYVGNFTLCDNSTSHIFGHTMSIPVRHKFITTAKRMGAPYRNPIAGWRRTLDCCEEPCFVTLTQTGVPGVAITRGVSQYSQTQQDGTICTGTITDYYPSNQSASVDLIRITVQLDNCCCIPFARGGEITGGIGQTPSPYEFIATNVVVISRKTSGATKQPINTVYKDRYSGGKGAGDDGCGACAVDCTNTLAPRSGIEGRTHRPIIRSGMQEKRPCCRTSTGKCNKTNDYSFSYWQYKHNKRCLDYERNQEKYVRNFPACGMFHGRFQCLNAYRKSSCCDCTCEPCKQVISLFITPPDINIGDLITQTGGGNPNGATGTVVAILLTEGGNQATFEVETTSCDKPFNINGGPGTGNVTIQFPSGLYSNQQATFGTVSGGGGVENCNNKTMAKTIYKPSNKKFSHQGAVTSGGRLERLKLDTIKSANSKCIKGQKCITIPSKFVGLNKTYKYPNGKYGAGKPRFTGWMFNGHHQEVKSRVYNMVRYNQQPLGIPQLTAHRLTLSQGGNGCGPKQCFPRTLNLGSNRPTAAGNRARIPGSKCITKNPCDCLPAADNNFTVAQGPGGFADHYGKMTLPLFGAFVPQTINGSTLNAIYWDNGVDPSFNLALAGSPAQTIFSSISFVNCDEKGATTVRTYNSANASFRSVLGASVWEWGSAQSGFTAASELVYWSGAVGQTLKVYIDNVPQIPNSCPECNCSCTNLQYQTGQGVPCC